MLEKNFLHDQYINCQKSIGLIARENNCGAMTIYGDLIKFGIPIRKNKKYHIPKDILHTEYVLNKKRIKDIAEVFGCSNTVVIATLKLYNIEPRIGKPIKETIINKNLLEELYIKQNLRIRQIADKLNFSERYISDSLKRFNIKRKRKVQENIYICPNDKFGRITVVTCEENNKYECLCACGTALTLSKSNLIGTRAVKSCGCARANNSNWRIVPPYFFNGIKCKAEHRGILFNITHEYADELFVSQYNKCALSGVELSFGRSRCRKDTTASLDRIDATKPYTAGNVQWIHKQINTMKHVLNNNEFINWCLLIGEFNR